MLSGSEAERDPGVGETEHELAVQIGQPNSRDQWVHRTLLSQQTVSCRGHDWQITGICHS